MATKVCRTCGEAVPLSGFYKGGTGKPRPDCKECTKKAQRAKNDHLKQRSPEEAITKTEKRCNGCGQTLPVAQFGIALVHPYGLKPICKPCEAKRSMQWVNATPERMQARKDRAKSWRGDNPEFSGMPPAFEQWCKTSWLPANLGRDFYRKQAETHIQSLAAKVSRLQKEI